MSGRRREARINQGTVNARASLDPVVCVCREGGAPKKPLLKPSLKLEYGFCVSCHPGMMVNFVRYKNSIVFTLKRPF